MSRINLGDEVKDAVSGVKGIVTARTFWLYGCERLLVQPRGQKDGRIPEPFNVDEPQAILIKAGVVTPLVRKFEREPNHGGRQDFTTRAD